MNPILPENIDQRDAELITAYLRNELSAAGRAEIETRRKSDAAFDALVKGLVRLAAATRLANVESALIMLQDHAKSHTQARVVSTQRRYWLSRAAVAMILLVIAACALFLIPRKHDRIFSEHFSNKIVPGKGELGANPFPAETMAFDHYTRERYARAAREFDRLLSSRNDEEYLLYAAVSHLGAGHLDKAEQLLDQSMIKFPKNRAEIVFFQTLVHVRRNNLEVATHTLETHQELVRNNPALAELSKDLQETR